MVKKTPGPCWTVAALLAAVLGVVAAQSAEPADVLFIRCRAYTLDEQTPQTDAIAIRDGTIVALGDAARALKSDQTRVVDVGGACVIPGLIDAHGHMAGLGSYELGLLDLSGARSFDDVVAAVESAAKRTQAGTWILGGRWDHESWTPLPATGAASSTRELPTHERLSAAAPQNPVWLRRVDGHAGIANAAAMRLAGITRDTSSPPGGEILKQPGGEPTGAFVDRAMDLITSKVDQPAPDAEALILKAQERCLSLGLTGVHDAGVDAAEIEAYERLAADGRLKLRMHLMVHGAIAEEYFAQHPPRSGPRVSVRACKLYADGAMGSRGAWLLAPYSDRPTNDAGEPYAGLALTRPEKLVALTRDALRRGYQVCTHAIGDRANRVVLDAYEAALAAVPESQRAVAQPRLRVEHAQLVDPADMPRFARLGVVASMQPTHCTSDMRWVEQRVGSERARGAYAWASLIRAGAILAGGSDFPVESPNPMLGLHAAVTRQTLDGQPTGGWRAEERLSRQDALRMATLGGAYAGFAESQVGSLAIGKRADFVVLDRDYFDCSDAELGRIRVLRTVIDGQDVYLAPVP